MACLSGNATPMTRGESYQLLTKSPWYTYLRSVVSPVPAVGIEPTRGYPQRILSPQRLPFRHAGTILGHQGPRNWRTNDTEPCDHGTRALTPDRENFDPNRCQLAGRPSKGPHSQSEAAVAPHLPITQASSYKPLFQNNLHQNPSRMTLCTGYSAVMPQPIGRSRDMSPWQTLPISQPSRRNSIRPHGICRRVKLCRLVSRHT